MERNFLLANFGNFLSSLDGEFFIKNDYFIKPQEIP